jgi:hypothetical protein
VGSPKVSRAFRWAERIWGSAREKSLRMHWAQMPRAREIRGDVVAHRRHVAIQAGFQDGVKLLMCLVPRQVWLAGSPPV